MTFSLSNAVKSAVPVYLGTLGGTMAPCIALGSMSRGSVLRAFKLGRGKVVGGLINCG